MSLNELTTSNLCQSVSTHDPNVLLVHDRNPWGNAWTDYPSIWQGRLESVGSIWQKWPMSSWFSPHLMTWRISLLFRYVSRSWTKIWNQFISMDKFSKQPRLNQCALLINMRSIAPVLSSFVISAAKNLCRKLSVCESYPQVRRYIKTTKRAISVAALTSAK